MQSAEVQNGWALCWQRGATWSFWCPRFPRTASVSVRMGWWGVAKCALAIGIFIAGNVVAAYKIKKLGGIWKAARRILNTKTGEERAKVILSILGDLAGLTQVVDACA